MVVTESRRVSKIHIWTFTNFPGFLWNQCHDKDETFFFFKILDNWPIFQKATPETFMALILSKIYERGIEKSDRKFPTPNRKKYLIYQEQGSHGVIAEREQVCFETGTAISRIILIRLDRRRSWRNWKAWSHSRALMLTYSTTRWFVTWTTIASAIWICWTLDDTTSRAAPRNSIGIASISAVTRSRTFWRGSRWPANFQTTITSGSLWCMDTNISANWRSYEKMWVVSFSWMFHGVQTFIMIRMSEKRKRKYFDLNGRW